MTTSSKAKQTELHVEHMTLLDENSSVKEVYYEMRESMGVRLMDFLRGKAKITIDHTDKNDQKLYQYLNSDTRIPEGFIKPYAWRISDIRDIYLSKDDQTSLGKNNVAVLQTATSCDCFYMVLWVQS